MKIDRDGSKPRRSASAAALALLARREHSRLELLQKLQQRAYPETEIAAALDALSEEGLLSDQRATRSRIISGLNRGLGPARIRQSLQRAGLPTDVPIADADEVAVDWVDQARQLAQRKFGTEPPSDYQQWAKRARFLQARGYGTDTIRKALSGQQD